MTDLWALPARSNNNFEVDDEIGPLDVKQRSTDDWIPVVEEEMRQGFPVDGPQWRVRLLKPVQIMEKGHGIVYETAVVITVNHCLCDGTSFVRLFDQLMDELGLCSHLLSSSSSASSFSRYPVVSQPLLPSVEDALPKEWFQVHPVRLFLDYLAIQQRHLLHCRRRLFFPKRVLCQFLSAIGRTDVSRSGVKPRRRVLPVDISQELSENWVRACKKNGAKHHGTMTTVAKVALARAAMKINGRNVKEGGKAEKEAAASPLTFVSKYPVSARHMAVNPSPPPGAIMMYIYVRHVAATVSDSMTSAAF